MDLSGGDASAKMGASPEAQQETDDLDLHLKTLLGRAVTPAGKAAFKAAVHACMDEYGPEEDTEPPSSPMMMKP